MLNPPAGAENPSVNFFALLHKCSIAWWEGGCFRIPIPPDFKPDLSRQRNFVRRIKRNMDWLAHREGGWMAYLLGTSRGCWYCSQHWMGITCWIFCGKNCFSTPSSGLNVWYQGKRTYRRNPFPRPSFHPSSYFRSGIGNQGPLFMDGLFAHLYARSHSTFLKTSSCL